MNDVLIKPAPSFEEPIEMLSACHERMTAQLETLRRLAAWLPDKGADAQARQAAKGILRYFRSAAANHHQDEEVDVFPRLLERVGSGDRLQVERLVASLLADHQELYAAWDRLSQSLVQIESGGEADLSEQQADYFALQYRNHIECEEAMLFPFLRRYFSPEDLAEIGTRMSARRQCR